MDKAIIRTSDRKHFKDCRRAWDIGSKIRQDLEPIAIRKNLDRGSTFHRAMEVFWDPATWHLVLNPDTRPTIEDAAVQVLLDEHKRQHQDYLKFSGLDEMPDEMKADYEEWNDLGPGMLRHFFRTAVDVERWEPIYTEIEFEVPVRSDLEGDLPPNFDCGEENALFLLHEVDDGVNYIWVPVVYQGRIDLIVKDKNDKYWIVDWKTAAQFRDKIALTELNEQMMSYAWAARIMLGLDIKGVIYAEVYKGYPQPPARLATPRQGRLLSTNKQQDTSYEMMLEAIEEVGQSPELYDDYLTYLKNDGKQFYREQWIPYSETQLNNLGEQIFHEAIDMLNDPRIYPHPTYFECDRCDHLELCLAINDGSDVEYIKSRRYRKRKDERPVGVDGEEPGRSASAPRL